MFQTLQRLNLEIVTVYITIYKLENEHNKNMKIKYLQLKEIKEDLKTSTLGNMK